MKIVITFFLLVLCQFSHALLEIKKLPEKLTSICKTINSEYLVFHGTANSIETPPLLIFLHGAGERGSNISKLTTGAGVPPIRFYEKTQKLPFLVLAPQCLPNTSWNIDDLEIWFEHILSTEKFDRSRVYLTGLSMGGFGTFRWIAKDSSRFSAAASICGGWERNNLQIKPLPNELTNLASIPLWVFHGEKDKIVPAKQSINMVNWIKKSGSKNIKFSLFKTKGHAIWDESYVNNGELYEWFLNINK